MFLSVFATLAAGAFAVAPGTSSLQNILKNTHASNDYGYPTDITRDILPVGHDESSLTYERTLENLYINPILDVLERQNPDSPFLTGPTKNGVWDTDTAQTLYFFIDVKTSGHETFEAVIKALEPLRQKGYLTTLKGGETVENGPVTIIGTGDTPLDMVLPVKDRDYFFDAPLDALADSKYSKVDHRVSPIASTNFVKAVGQVNIDTEPVLGDEQLKALRSQISLAKERGIGARYWNTPNWPVRQRNLVWRTLLQEGVGLLNADDLDAVASFF
ncbi:unnamed protein product [Penicillium pancosmium]